MDTIGCKVVLMILIINVMLAFIIFVLSFFQNKAYRNTFRLLSWFLFIVPLFGFLYLLLGKFISFIYRKKYVDMSDVSFSHEREKLILPPEQETEMNYAPIQDAMAVSDTASLRKLLLDTLRNNAKKTVSSIAVALNSKDTEASHYVATIILDALSEFRSTAQNMIEQMEKLPEDVETNLMTFEYIHEILSMKIMTNVEQESYIYTLNNVAENLHTNNLWHMTATHYLWMTDLFLSIKDYSMAQLWISRANQYRPDVLDTYKANLHYYFDLHNKEVFFQYLKKLKNDSDIVIDEEILNLFRLYKE